MFCLRNSTSSSFSCWGSWDLIWKNFSRSSPIVTFTRSLHFASSAGLSMDNTGGFNCYKSFSLWVEGSASGLCRMVATMHCRAMAWSSSISSIWPLDGYLTFWCRVEETAPKVWSKVWQQLLYKESMHPQRWNLLPPSPSQSTQAIWLDPLG